MTERTTGENSSDALAAFGSQPSPQAREARLTLTGGESLRVRVHTATSDAEWSISGEAEITLFLARALPTAEAESLPVTPSPTPVLPQESPQPESKERKEVKNLVGRLGNEPVYKPLPRRELHVEFRLGEHLDDGATAWHNCYSTGEHAKRIQAREPHLGDEVEIIRGERHHNPRRDKTLKDGTVKPYIETFCYAVRVRKRNEKG